MKAANLTFNSFEYETLKKIFSIKQYSSIDIDTLHNYLDNIDESWFEYVKIGVDQTIESVLYSYYKSEDYYDLILLLNYRNLLDDIPYSNDKIINDINSDLEEYNIKLFNQGTAFNAFTIEPEIYNQNRLSNPDELKRQRRLGPYQRLKIFLGYKYNQLNSYRLFLKVAKPQYLYKIINDLKDLITTHQEVLELQSYEYGD
jgi:hypothetical protein